MQLSDKPGFAWRKWNRLIHRDLGYIAFGLTLIYSISGIAVNHLDDWNPNYLIDNRSGTIDPALVLASPDSLLATRILTQAGLPAAFRATYRPSPQEFTIFLEDANLTIHLGTGVWKYESEQPRFLLHFFNFLHLNHAKQIWTWIADVFAAALILLAITGILMIKGPKGITGRGAWLTAAGIVVPLILGWLYYN